VSELAKAAEALAAGRREDALIHARNAARGARRQDLPELAGLAAELKDPALLAAVTVRRFRTRRWRMWRMGERIETALVVMLVFGWWFGWSLLITLLTISNRVVAVVVALVATPLLIFGAAKDWIRMDD
jgi:hypothetical protein